MTIPSRAFFLWLGPSFPWTNELAIRTAVEQGQFDQVILYVDQYHENYPGWSQLREMDRVEIRMFDLDEVVGSVEHFGPKMVDIYNKLGDPSSKSNIVRHALVTQHGGVYLDTDTITLQPISPLLKASRSFAGYEHIVFPFSVRRSKNPWVKLKAQGKGLLRDFCRRLPKGWESFNKISSWYPLAANVAILGSEPQGEFMLHMLDRMVRMPEELQCKRNALGPHLIQESMLDRTWSPDVFTCHDPQYFYPLGPEISEHWFRKTYNPNPDQVLTPQTYIVHWYASVRTKHIIPHINPGYIQEHKETQLFSTLASSVLENVNY